MATDEERGQRQEAQTKRLEEMIEQAPLEREAYDNPQMTPDFQLFWWGPRQIRDLAQNQQDRLFISALKRGAPGLVYRLLDAGAMPSPALLHQVKNGGTLLDLIVTAERDPSGTMSVYNPPRHSKHASRVMKTLLEQSPESQLKAIDALSKTYKDYVDLLDYALDAHPTLAKTIIEQQTCEQLTESLKAKGDDQIPTLYRALAFPNIVRALIDKGVDIEEINRHLCEDKSNLLAQHNDQLLEIIRYDELEVKDPTRLMEVNHDPHNALSIVAQQVTKQPYGKLRGLYRRMEREIVKASTRMSAEEQQRLRAPLETKPDFPQNIEIHEREFRTRYVYDELTIRRKARNSALTQTERGLRARHPIWMNRIMSSKPTPSTIDNGDDAAVAPPVGKTAPQRSDKEGSARQTTLAQPLRAEVIQPQGGNSWPRMERLFGRAQVHRPSVATVIKADQAAHLPEAKLADQGDLTAPIPSAPLLSKEMIADNVLTTEPTKTSAGSLTTPIPSAPPLSKVEEDAVPAKPAQSTTTTTQTTPRSDARVVSAVVTPSPQPDSRSQLERLRARFTELVMPRAPTTQIRTEPNNEAESNTSRGMTKC